MPRGAIAAAVSQHGLGAVSSFAVQASRLTAWWIPGQGRHDLQIPVTAAPGCTTPELQNDQSGIPTSREREPSIARPRRVADRRADRSLGRASRDGRDCNVFRAALRPIARYAIFPAAWRYRTEAGRGNRPPDQRADVKPSWRASPDEKQALTRATKTFVRRRRDSQGRRLSVQLLQRPVRNLYSAVQRDGRNAVSTVAMFTAWLGTAAARSDHLLPGRSVASACDVEHLVQRLRLRLP